MIIKTVHSCIHCNQTAHEYEGLEGGLYIGMDTERTCPKSADGDHDFKPKKELNDNQNKA